MSFYMFFTSATNFSSMQWSSLFNNWWQLQNSFCRQYMVYYKHLWSLRNENTWPLYVHMGQVIYNAWPTRSNIIRGHSTWCLAQFFPSAWHTIWEFISPQQFNWFGLFMLHLKYSGPQGCNIISTTPQSWSWSQSMILVLASPVLRFTDHWVESVHEANPNPLQLSFSIEVWDNILAYKLDQW